MLCGVQQLAGRLLRSGRFKAVAVVSLHDPELAAAEARRAVEDKGPVAVILLLSSYPLSPLVGEGASLNLDKNSPCIFSSLQTNRTS